MEKYLVSYAQAVALKELGFNENCFATFDSDECFEVQDFEQNYDTFPSHIIAAPLKSQVFEWFRKEHDLHSHIFSKEDKTYVWCIRWYVDGIQKDTPYKSSNSYEEAESACIDKLIEIVRDGKNID